MATSIQTDQCVTTACPPTHGTMGIESPMMTQCDQTYTTLHPAAYYTQDELNYYGDCVLPEVQQTESPMANDSILIATQLSMPPPNQQVYSNLDSTLYNLPRDIYIERLVSETSNNSNTIYWYRRILGERAKRIDKCPTGELKNRKSTSKSSSSYKLAADCYIITHYLQGDSSEIESIFSVSTLKKKKHSASESDIFQSSTINADIVTLKATLHSAITRITNLESTIKDMQKKLADSKDIIDNAQSAMSTITKTQSGIEVIQKHITEHNTLIKTITRSGQQNTERIDKLTMEQTNKFTQFDSFRKMTANSMRGIDNFDSHINDKRIKSIEDSSKNMQSQITNCNKLILSYKSFANSVSPQRAENNNENKQSSAGTKQQVGTRDLPVSHMNTGHQSLFANLPKPPRIANSRDNINDQTQSDTRAQIQRDTCEVTKTHTGENTHSDASSIGVGLGKTTTHDVRNSSMQNDENVYSMYSHQDASENKHSDNGASGQDRELTSNTNIDKLIGDKLTEMRKPTTQLSATIQDRNHTSSRSNDHLENAVIDLTHTRNESHTRKEIENTQTQRDKNNTPMTNSSNERRTTTNAFSGTSQNRQPHNNVESTFKGVSYRNTIRYHIGHIDKNSTYTGLIEFLEINNLSPSMVRMFKTRNGEQAARLNIPADEKDIVESSEIQWPDGIIVSKWQSKHQIKQARQQKSNDRYRNRDYTNAYQDSPDYEYHQNLRISTGNNTNRKVTYDTTDYVNSQNNDNWVD